MIKFNSLFNISDHDRILVDDLSQKLDITRLTSKVLINRRITNVDCANNFLNPNMGDLLDPFLLDDMNVAVKRIVEAIDNNESIWVYGDYDVDGITSTSILIIYLKTLCKNVYYYIPDRMTEGYGLNIDAMDYIKSKGGQLVISVDCGIKSFDVADHCKRIGMDLIITDHHTCEKELPDAMAVINPNRIGGSYPFTKLAGVGVAFKLIQALAFELKTNIDYTDILPIVAIGTVADVVSLTGENRIIVKNGLSMIKETNNFGIKALLEVTGLVNKEITSGHVGFVIGPRINATGRIGMAKYGVELLTANTYEKALDLATMLDEENIKRQKIEAGILNEAEELIHKGFDLEKDKILVLASENWHSGVIGIVSSRITEKYYRPSILIALEDDEGRGSARSIPNFDLYENLSKCKDLFVRFGGHKQAAGLTIKKNNINEFRKKINEAADQVLEDIDLIPETIIDAEIDIDDITLDAAHDIKSLEPFGIDNPSPIFFFKDGTIKSIRAIGKDERHLKMVIEKHGTYIDCVGFNLGYYINRLKIGQKLDLVVTLSINDYLGQQSIQLIIKEIVPSHIDIFDGSYDYLETLLPVIRESYSEARELDIGNNILCYMDEEDRKNYIIENLYNEDNILIIINNILNLAGLFNIIQCQGRNFVRNINISYKFPKGHKPYDIIINPMLSQIDKNKYKKVVIYDFCFRRDYFEKIVDFFKEINLKALIVEEDFNKNKSFIKELMPEIEELRLVYKTFINRKEKIFIIKENSYLNYLESKTNVHISKLKLNSIIRILKEAELIDYAIKSDSIYIKMMEAPDEKIDIINVDTYDILSKAYNETISFQNGFKSIK